MVDYTYHGDGSVTVKPSKGQTGGSGFGSQGTYKSEEKARGAVEAAQRGDKPEPPQNNLSKMKQLTRKEGLILGRQPIGEPAYGSQLYYKTRMLQSETAQWKNEKDFTQAAAQVSPYLKSGTELRGQIVSEQPASSLLPHEKQYQNRYVKPTTQKEYYAVTYPKGFGNINIFHEYRPNDTLGKNETTPLKKGYNFRGNGGITTDNIRPKDEFKDVFGFSYGRPQPGKQYSSDILGVIGERGNISQDYIRSQEGKLPTVSVMDLKVNQALNMAWFSPFLIKSPYMATLSKSKDPWAKIPTMRQSSPTGMSRNIRDMGAEIRAASTEYPAGKKQVSVTLQISKQGNIQDSGGRYYRGSEESSAISSFRIRNRTPNPIEESPVKSISEQKAILTEYFGKPAQKKSLIPISSNKYRTYSISSPISSSKYRTYSISSPISSSKSLTYPISAAISKQILKQNQKIGTISILKSNTTQTQGNPFSLKSIYKQVQTQAQTLKGASIYKINQNIKTVTSNDYKIPTKTTTKTTIFKIPKIPEIPKIPSLSLPDDMFGSKKKRGKKKRSSWQVKNPFLSLTGVTE